MIAGALGLTEFTSGTSSRYIGVPEINAPSNFKMILENIGIVISIAVLTGAIGMGIGIIICGVFTSKKDKFRREPEKRISEQDDTQKYPYYSDRDVPRSINDYYKKQK